MTPGWYPDQHDPDRLRWYDGRAWTGDTMPARGPEPTAPVLPRSTGSDRAPDAPDAPATLVQPAASEPVAPPWHTRWWVVGGVALVIGLLVGTAVTGARDLEDAARSPVAGPTVTATATVTETASPPTASADSDGATATFPMPDETGRGLQDAQDDLQRLSGRTFFRSGSTDASGQGRGQFLDSDWQVCTQNVDPGTPVSVDDDSVSFAVVRVDETCP